MIGRIMATVAAAGLLAACDTTPTNPPGVGGDYVTLGQYPKVTATGGLANYLVVNDVVESRDGDVLSVEVDVRWTGRYTSFFNYRFIFFDEIGRALNPDPAWQRGRAAPGVVDYLTGNAVSSAAVDWRLEIRAQN